jgi:hypothetical protein
VESATHASPRGIDQKLWRLSVALACLATAGLTVVGLLVGPASYSDPGFGFLAWRGLLEGAPFNHIPEPDPIDIARDRATFFAYWSPGQYLVPGIISLPGVRMGTAIVLTAGGALLIGLLGWLRVARTFAFPAAAGLLLAATLPLLRFSTLTFGIYTGGEALLQAALPWMILLSLRVPRAGAAESALVAFAVVAIGFSAKLTGVIAASAALGAACLPQFLKERRLTAGMVFGALSASAALALVYVLWLARGPSAVGGSNGEGAAANIAFMVLAPWTAGLSLLDLLFRIFLFPSGEILSGPGVTLWLLAPFAGLIADRDARDVGVQAWLNFAGVFCLLFGSVLLVMMLGLAGISMEERHVRPIGVVILISLVVIAMTAQRHGWRRRVVAGLCAIMASYGLGSFVFRALNAYQADTYDAASGLQQAIVDRPALDYLRAAYAQEGRDALFVIPSPEVALALPLGARIIATHLDFTPESDIACLRFQGVIPGTVFVVMQSRLLPTKGQALLHAFADYDMSRWQIRSFGQTSILSQKK